MTNRTRGPGQDQKAKGRERAKLLLSSGVPTELLKLGAVGSTPKGNRLCFGYNLKTCQAPVTGQKCERGLHLCCVRGCMKQHPAVDCPNKKANWLPVVSMDNESKAIRGDMTMTMRRVSSTRQKRRSTQGHYVSSMPTSWSAWFLDLWSDSVLWTLWKKHDPINKQKVEGFLKSFLNMQQCAVCCPHMRQRLIARKLLVESWMGVPAGAKLLRSEAKGGGSHLYFFGIFRGMQQFVNIAKQLWHPLMSWETFQTVWFSAFFASSGEKIDLHALDHTIWRLQAVTRFCIHGGHMDFLSEWWQQVERSGAFLLAELTIGWHVFIAKNPGEIWSHFQLHNMSLQCK